MPSPGVVVERSYIPSQPYEIAKNDEKTGGFAHILAYKSPKTPFFALKYLTRYTHETFFYAYTNFEGHYLSRCRDIPLQSFGSHICPQPHGLGLTLRISPILASLLYLNHFCCFNREGNTSFTHLSQNSSFACCTILTFKSTAALPQGAPWAAPVVLFPT